MISDGPIRWTDPVTWPWVFYVWLAFILAGFAKPAWNRLRNQRATSWPVTDGRVESVQIDKPSLSFTTKRGYYIAELGYSYSVAGTRNSGRYKRDFPTQHEAEEFVRDLRGTAVVVHYRADRASSSTLLEADIQTLLQNRAPAPVSDFPSESPVPDWLRPFLWLFIFLSAIGLCLSLWIHLGAVMGRRVAPQAFLWMLQVGIFVVWLPAILVAQKLVGNVNRKDLWKLILKDLPDWMRYMVYGILGYDVVISLLFLRRILGGGNGANPPTEIWRESSGHWMAFYSAALAILYSAARIGDTSLRCANGHLASPNTAYCPKCGQPVLRGR
jgi:hypothetical protein